MKWIVGFFVLILVLGAVAWWVLKDRPEEDAPYADALLEGMDKAGIQRVQGDFRAIHQALTNYAASEGAYPEENLGRALGPYIARVPSKDPWGTSYRYTFEGDEDYTLESAGPDLTWGTADDIVSESGNIITE
jgi:hypothetical protein